MDCLLFGQHVGIQFINVDIVVMERCLWFIDFHVAVVFVSRMVCQLYIDLIEFRALVNAKCATLFSFSTQFRNEK